MRKKASPDTLYRLVKSLTPQEKAILKAYSAVLGMRGGDYSMIWKLIDFLYNEPHFDQARLKEAFKDCDLAALKRDAKKWLFRVLYRSGIRSNVEAHDLAGSSFIAIERDDPGGARRIIRKAKAICQRRELFLVQLQLLLNEIEIVPTNLKGEKLQEYFEQNIKETEKVQRLLENQMAFNRLRKSVLIPTQNHFATFGNWKYGAIQKLENEPLLQDKEKALSNRARIIFHDAWLLIYTAHQDWEKCADKLRETIAIFEKAKWLKEELNERYMLAIRQGCQFNNILRRRKESASYLQMLERMEKEYRGGDHAMLASLVLAKFSFSDVYGDQDEADCAFALVEKYQSEIGFWAKPMEQITIYFWSLKYLVSTGQKSGVYPLVNSILQFEGTEYKLDFQVYARLVHSTFMLDELLNGDESKADLLESYGRNYARFVKKHSDNFPTCFRVLNFLRESPRYLEKGTMSKKVAELESDLDRLLTDDPMAVHYFSFGDWIENLKSPNL